MTITTLNAVVGDFAYRPVHGWNELDKRPLSEDFNVEFEGKRFYISVFSVDGIKERLDWWSVSGEFGAGSYFSCSDLIVVKEIDRETIEKAFAYIVKSGEIFDFTVIDGDQD